MYGGNLCSSAAMRHGGRGEGLVDEGRGDAGRLIGEVVRGVRGGRRGRDGVQLRLPRTVDCISQILLP